MNYCRWCRGTLITIFALGNIPIVNYFPTPRQAKREKLYPLSLCACNSCGLVQVRETISPRKLFGRYHYMTGASRPLVAQLQEFARKHRAHKVLDIGSNDGTLLCAFAKQGSMVLGVEPSDLGEPVPTIHDFFSFRLAKKIKKTHGTFDLVTVMHVLANIPNLHDFLRGIHEILSEDGVCVIEVGSLDDIVKYGQFDSVYHEHYSYFSKNTLKYILSNAGFQVTHIEHIRAQGGSYRITAKKGHASSAKPASGDYQSFVKKITSFRTSIRDLIRKDLKGKTVVGFGAPAKGVTLLNYCGFGPNDIAYVVDSTSQKQGRMVPGVHIPVYSEEKLQESHIDAIVLLSWNYREEIFAKIRKFVHYPVGIITPFPKLVYTRIP